MKSEVYNIDCVEFMKQYPDNHWELAIVDVPYGIKWASKPVSTSGLRTHSITNKKSFVKGNNFAVKDWDNAIPKQEYFDDLFRVSKNQIIWGENYLQFNQKPISSGRIFWDKINGDTTFADGEIAWCSSTNTIRKFEFLWKGMMQGKSISEGKTQQGNKKLNEKKTHPTQKPVKLYEWILTNYAKAGDKILDTHGGSMSSVIACLNLGFKITCTELDKDYYEQAKLRITEHQKQQSLFNPTQEIQFIN